MFYPVMVDNTFTRRYILQPRLASIVATHRTLRNTRSFYAHIGSNTTSLSQRFSVVGQLDLTTLKTFYAAPSDIPPYTEALVQHAHMIKASTRARSAFLSMVEEILVTKEQDKRV